MSQTTSSAYDTAAIFLVKPEPDLIEWLLVRQYPDGSWGGSRAFASDRLLQTSLVTRALLVAEQQGVPTSPDALSRAAHYLTTALEGWRDEALSECDLAGFELLLPTHLRQLAGLGLTLPPLPEAIHNRWQRKVAILPPHAASDPRFSQLWHAAEFLEQQRGGEEQTYALARSFTFNGLVGSSPSATAYLLRQAGLSEASSQQLYTYLAAARNPDGGYPTTYPLTSFITLWQLYFRLHIAPQPDDGLQLDALLAGHDLSIGIGGNQHFAADADDTAVATLLAARLGRPEIARRLTQVLLDRFYKPAVGYFCTYELEVTPSLTTNAHVLEAFTVVTPLLDPIMQLAVRAISRRLTTYLLTQSTLRDKWHVSPYYSGLAVAAALAGQPPESAVAAWQRQQLTYLLANQRNGGWGIGNMTTMEETAYAVLTLPHLHSGSDAAVTASLRRASAYLSQPADDEPGPELWIDKTLYQPVAVVKAAIQAALLVIERSISTSSFKL